MQKTIHNTLHFIFRVCDNVSHMHKEAVSPESRIPLCVSTIYEYCRLPISDVDTKWIFKESHKKNYCEIDGKQHECRNVTLFKQGVISTSISLEKALKPTLAFIPW